MADQSMVDEVTELLPEGADAAGWTESRVAGELDDGKSKAVILLQWWNYRTATTFDWIDVAEAGSDRKLGDIHANAKAMAAYWQGIVDKETAALQLLEDEGRGRARMHRAVRV